MENVNVPALVRDLSSEDDSVRKMAAFKLQSVIGDPSFADMFISEDGLPKLRLLALAATGNTLAYTLTSFSNLLELDQGWDYVDSDVIRRLVELLDGQPLVNILRSAMSVLVAVISHPQARNPGPPTSGFRALKPAIAEHPHFLEMLVDRLSSADHALCANALQLINSLMRDALTNDSIAEWPKFIKRLQDVGVIKAVYTLMQSSGLQDLAHALLEFQTLTKALLRKWREMPVDLEKPEHRRTLKAIYVAGKTEQHKKEEANGSRKHDPEKWARLGFEADSPADDFDEVGFLGLMDLTDFVKKNEDGYQKLLLEQSTRPAEDRCPLAKASLAVTSILYDHFEVDRTENEDQGRYVALESRSNFDKVFKPLLLQWSRLHTSGLQAFLRLWATTGAQVEDFEKIEELVRILIEHVVGLAPRTRDVLEVEEDLADYELQRLRDLQMELLELTHDDAWGHHLRQVKDELHHEALQFMREQRIRCLLQGAWFPNSTNTQVGEGNAHSLDSTRPLPWRYVRLSHNRRHLHFADFEHKTPTGDEPKLDVLDSTIDLSLVSSVVSNVSPSSRDPSPTPSSPSTVCSRSRSAHRHKSTSSRHHPRKEPSTNTTITIHGYLSPPSAQPSKPAHYEPPPRNESSLSNTNPTTTATTNHNNPINSKDGTLESPILKLHPATHTLASEWLDGLLLLLNQTPITAETNKLVDFIAKYGLRIRLLNVRFEEALGGIGGAGGGGEGGASGGVYGREVTLPDREGVDEEFFYDVGGV